METVKFLYCEIAGKQVFLFLYSKVLDERWRCDIKLSALDIVGVNTSSKATGKEGETSASFDTLLQLSNKPVIENLEGKSRFEMINNFRIMPNASNFPTLKVKLSANIHNSLTTPFLQEKSQDLFLKKINSEEQMPLLDDSALKDFAQKLEPIEDIDSQQINRLISFNEHSVQQPIPVNVPFPVINEEIAEFTKQLEVTETELDDNSKPKPNVQTSNEVAGLTLKTKRLTESLPQSFNKQVKNIENKAVAKNPDPIDNTQSRAIPQELNAVSNLNQKQAILTEIPDKSNFKFSASGIETEMKELIARDNTIPQTVAKASISPEPILPNPTVNNVKVDQSSIQPEEKLYNPGDNIKPHLITHTEINVESSNTKQTIPLEVSVQNTNLQVDESTKKSVLEDNTKPQPIAEESVTVDYSRLKYPNSTEVIEQKTPVQVGASIGIQPDEKSFNPLNISKPQPIFQERVTNNYQNEKHTKPIEVPVQQINVYAEVSSTTTESNQIAPVENTKPQLIRKAVDTVETVRQSSFPVDNEKSKTPEITKVPILKTDVLVNQPEVKQTAPVDNSKAYQLAQEPVPVNNQETNTPKSTEVLVSKPNEQSPNQVLQQGLRQPDFVDNTKALQLAQEPVPVNNQEPKALKTTEVPVSKPNEQSPNRVVQQEMKQAAFVDKTKPQSMTQASVPVNNPEPKISRSTEVPFSKPNEQSVNQGVQQEMKQVAFVDKTKPQSMAQASVPVDNPEAKISRSTEVPFSKPNIQSANQVIQPEVKQSVPVDNTKTRQLAQEPVPVNNQGPKALKTTEVPVSKPNEQSANQVVQLGLKQPDFVDNTKPQQLAQEPVPVDNQEPKVPKTTEVSVSKPNEQSANQGVQPEVKQSAFVDNIKPQPIVQASVPVNNPEPKISSSTEVPLSKPNEKSPNQVVQPEMEQSDFVDKPKVQQLTQESVPVDNQEPKALKTTEVPLSKHNVQSANQVVQPEMEQVAFVDKTKPQSMAQASVPVDNPEAKISRSTEVPFSKPNEQSANQGVQQEMKQSVPVDNTKAQQLVQESVPVNNPEPKISSSTEVPLSKSNEQSVNQVVQPELKRSVPVDNTKTRQLVQESVPVKNPEPKISRSTEVPFSKPNVQNANQDIQPEMKKSVPVDKTKAQQLVQAPVPVDNPKVQQLVQEPVPVDNPDPKILRSTEVPLSKPNEQSANQVVQPEVKQSALVDNTKAQQLVQEPVPVNNPEPKISNSTEVPVSKPNEQSPNQGVQQEMKQSAPVDNTKALKFAQDIVSVENSEPKKPNATEVPVQKINQQTVESLNQTQVKYPEPTENPIQQQETKTVPIGDQTKPIQLETPEIPLQRPTIQGTDLEEENSSKQKTQFETPNKQPIAQNSPYPEYKTETQPLQNQSVSEKETNQQKRPENQQMSGNAPPEPNILINHSLQQINPQPYQQIQVWEKPVFSVPIRESQFTKDVFKFLQTAMSIQNAGDGIEAVFTLSPQHLGKIDVKVSIVDSQVTAEFIATTASGKELLESNVQSLRIALEAQGFQVEKINISQQNSSSFMGPFSQKGDSNTRQGSQDTRKRNERIVHNQEKEYRDVGYDSEWVSHINTTA